MNEQMVSFEDKSKMITVVKGSESYLVKRDKFFDKEEGSEYFLAQMGSDEIFIPDKFTNILPLIKYANGETDIESFDYYEQLVIADFLMFKSYFTFIMKFINNSPDVNRIKTFNDPLLRKTLSELSLTNVPYESLSPDFLELWCEEYKRDDEEQKELSDGIWYHINHQCIVGNRGRGSEKKKNGINLRWNDKFVTMYWHYVDDVKVGPQFSYYNNGVLRLVQNFVDGKNHGTEKSYYENGKPRLIREMEYGVAKSFQKYDKEE